MDEQIGNIDKEIKAQKEKSTDDIQFINNLQLWDFQKEKTL